jgi:hypothetical protein
MRQPLFWARRLRFPVLPKVSGLAVPRLRRNIFRQAAQAVLLLLRQGAQVNS